MENVQMDNYADLEFWTTTKQLIMKTVKSLETEQVACIW